MNNARPRVLLAALLLAAAPLAATEYYVTTAGTSSGTGTEAKPWALSTALQKTSLKGGDTVWIRGGTYTGHFVSALTGERNRPILVRGYPGERVVLDGNYGGNEVTLTIKGAYTWFRDIEVTNSDPGRTSPTGGSSAKPTRRGEGVNLLGPGNKLINSVVHDTAMGVLTTLLAPDAEVSGCLIYYNGWDAPDRGHGHAIYVQNDAGSKRIVDNIMFGQFGIGIHGYTEGGKLDSINLEGNTSFNNGMLSKVTGPTINFLVGANGSAAPNPESSGKVAKKTSLVNNYSYYSVPGGVAVNLGYSKGIASPLILDNYLVGSPALALVNAFRPIQMTGNTLYGALSGFAASEFPGNTFVSARPSGIKVFVRPNQYEPGRAHITVYNWDRAATVGVSLKDVLAAGTIYEIRNAQNFYGPAVLSGTYDGLSTVQLPMNLAPAAPVGLPAPASTGADFQVFVVVPKPAPSIERKPAASFSFGPRSPIAGEEVLFEDRSAGSPSSREWDFGDPSASPSQDGPAKTSHIYADPGTYTVRLTVSNAGGSSTRTREVTVASSPGSRRIILPVAGHVRGAAGSTYFTDVAVENPTGDAVSARLVFSSGDDPPLEAPLLLGPGESRVLADVVATQFAVDDAIGSIRVETDGAPPAPLRLACRTYLDDGGSTLGLGTVGLSSADETRGEVYLSNLAVSEAFRTNVGAVNSSAEQQTFALELRDGSGNILGRRNLSLPPGAQNQWALSQLFAGVSGNALTVRVVPIGSDLAPLAYAAVTDNASGDPTYYAAQAPSPVQYVPGIAGISGFGGAVFRSETSIANGGRGAATVTLTFLEHDRNNNSGAPKSTFVLGPYETLHVEDALPALFGVTETYGALRIQSDTSPGVTVFQRILTDAVATAGSVGQQIDALSAENLQARGTLLGVRQNDAFRSNIGLVNPNAAAVPVVLVLVRSPATDIGSATVHVPPQSYVQRNLAALFPSAGLAEDEVLSIRVDGGSHSVFAFASVIDNASQDPTYYPELH